MSFHSSIVCDTCEEHAVADNEDDGRLLGWFNVRFGWDEDDTTKDFCSLDCLRKWAVRGRIDLPDPAKGLDDGATA